MKKLVITGIAVLGLSLGALAQGTINGDNSNASNPNSTIRLGGNFYDGPINMEFWIQNGSNSVAQATINSTLGTSATAGYAALTAGGWTKESSATVLNGSVAGGQFGFGSITLPDVSPAGGTVTLAMAAWIGGSSYLGGANGGVMSLILTTGNPNASPPGTPGEIFAPWDALNMPLGLTPVPEPATLALAGLGWVMCLLRV